MCKCLYNVLNNKVDVFMLNRYLYVFFLIGDRFNVLINLKFKWKIYNEVIVFFLNLIK